MRLRHSRVKPFTHKPAQTVKDNEGTATTIYGDATGFLAEEWPGGGKLQSEMYGTRLPNIRNLRLDGTYEEVPGQNGALSYVVAQGETVFSVAAGDGICMGSDGDPDYKVTAIYPYSYLTLEVEKL